MQSKLPHFFEILLAGLVCGCLFSPFASAIAIMFICSARLAEKYFTRNIADADRAELQSLKIDLQTAKSEFSKIKLKVEQDSLAKAFGR